MEPFVLMDVRGRQYTQGAQSHTPQSSTANILCCVIYLHKCSTFTPFYTNSNRPQASRHATFHANGNLSRRCASISTSLVTMNLANLSVQG